MLAIDVILHLLTLGARWRWLLTPVAIVIGIVLIQDRPPKKGVDGAMVPRPGKKLGGWAWWTGAYLALNFFLGGMATGWLLHRLGETGHATITGGHGTSKQYNYHNVVGYDVLIRTAQGKAVETGFEDDDFNVYPWHNATRYPGVGDRFNVNYNRTFPRDFIIISNDDSPWAKSLRCGAMRSRVAQAMGKYEFARDDQAFRNDYIAAIDAAMASGCAADATELQAFRDDEANVRAGRP